MIRMSIRVTSLIIHFSPIMIQLLLLKYSLCILQGSCTQSTCVYYGGINYTLEESKVLKIPP